LAAALSTSLLLTLRHPQTRTRSSQTPGGKGEEKEGKKRRKKRRYEMSGKMDSIPPSCAVQEGTTRTSLKITPKSRKRVFTSEDMLAPT